MRKKASSPAPRRGSSSGDETRSDATKAKDQALPPWNDNVSLSPTPENKRAYGDLLTRYNGLPERVKHKLIQAEVSGKAFNMRLEDVAPLTGLRAQISGELYETLQKKYDELGSYTSLDFFRVLMQCDQLPMSMRVAAAKEMLPYEHPKRVAAAEPLEGEETRAAIIVPGAVPVKDWERLSAEHSERLRLQRDGKKK